MKFRIFMAVLCLVVFAILLIADLQTINRTWDKWLSFGMGLAVPVFIANLVAFNKTRRKMARK